MINFCFEFFQKKEKKKAQEIQLRLLKTCKVIKEMENKREREMWRERERERERRLKRKEWGRKLKLRLHITSTPLV
jgi:hypothetical protein